MIDNQDVNAVEGLVDVVNRIQIILNGYLSKQGGKMCLPELAKVIHDIKESLEFASFSDSLTGSLRYTTARLKTLHHTLKRLQSMYKSSNY